MMTRSVTQMDDPRVIRLSSSVELYKWLSEVNVNVTVTQNVTRVQCVYTRLSDEQSLTMTHT